MTVTVYTSVSLEPVTCYACGVIFGLPSDFHRNRVEDHKDWYCPNGHDQRFVGETDAQKYRRMWREEQERVVAVNRRLSDSENRLRTTKGVVTKMRKRAITGTCQYCHRHFANVERHVATKHPTETP